MTRLVALDLPGGPAFLDALTRCWELGDAVFVLDRRLPPAARETLLGQVQPDVVVGPDGTETQRTGPGTALAPGDALVVATSGSTGSPKLVVHTHEGLAAHARAVHHRLEVDPRRDRWLACLPLAHLGGFGVVARAVLTGTPVEVVGHFDAAVVEAAPDRGCTLVSLVPTALDRCDTGRYRWVVVGGSSDPRRRSANVVHTYGLTETGGGVVYDGHPLDGVEVEVADDGTIAVRGPMLARGRRSPDGEVAPIADADGWLLTGDRGRWVDGRLVVDGRADDVIVSGGENVWPGPVEQRLETHPAVAEVAVVGRSDPDWGERVVAVVVPADPARPPLLDELRSHVRASLPVWCAPRELVVVDALPRTALGKVARHRLLDQPPG